MSPLIEQVTVHVEFPAEMNQIVRDAMKIERPYKMGTDRGLFASMSRDRANLLINRLNMIEGVKARLFGE